MTLSPITVDRMNATLDGALLTTENAARIISDARRAMRRWQTPMNKIVKGNAIEARKEATVIREVVGLLAEMRGWTRAVADRRIRRAMQYVKARV